MRPSKIRPLRSIFNLTSSPLSARRAVRARSRDTPSSFFTSLLQPQPQQNMSPSSSTARTVLDWSLNLDQSSVNISLKQEEEQVKAKGTQRRHQPGAQTSADGDISPPKPKKAKQEEKNETNDNTIPDSVLQYERQKRKAQASFRSGAPLNADEHLLIVYEDEEMIVTDKPSGVLCVPGLHKKPNLLDLVMDYCNIPSSEDRSKLIVHRLDMDTSGLCIYAKTTDACKFLQAEFRNQTPTKEYQALVCGHFIPSSITKGSIDLPLQRDHEHPPFMRVATKESEAAAAAAVKDLQAHGYKKLIKKNPKPSQTQFRILSRDFLEHDNQKVPVTRIALIPKTGRTHQLRVHCAALGHPIVSDPAYGLYGEGNARGGMGEWQNLDILKSVHRLKSPDGGHKMCLHARTLTIRHPTSKELVTFEAPVPF